MSIAARRLLGLAFANADMLLEIESGGVILLALGAAQASLGVDEAGLVGRSVHDLVVEADRPVEVLLDLGFGRCRLVAAAREESAWRGLADLPAGVRVATAFPRLAQAMSAPDFPPHVPATARRVAPHCQRWPDRRRC